MIKPLRHAQAQRWIQASSDGALGEEETARLDAHLQACPSCRVYAMEFRAFDAGLRSHFSARRSAHLVERLPGQPHALDTLHQKMRANMNHKRTYKLASSFAFVLILVALGIGLSVLPSMGIYPAQLRPRETQPVILPTSEPSVTPSATPFPWTEAAPLTDRAQIAETLSTLAQKNIAALQKGEWMYTQRRDLSETGMMQVYASDTWTRLPAAEETCAPYLAVVKDGPQDGQVIQIRVNLADGTVGDLVSLRQGQGEVEHYGPDDLMCQLSVETTSAGQLVPYIDPDAEQPLAKKPSRLIEARAWYTELDGRIAFVVSAIFDEGDESPTPEEYRQTYEEIRHFDLQSGALLREHIVMKWADGSLFGESRAGYQSEFLPTLPEAVAQEFELYEKELKLVQELQEALQAMQEQKTEQIRAELEALRQSAGISIPVQTVPTPEGAAQEASQVPLDDLPYTQESPLTDLVEMRAILDALQERREAKLSEPGWYLYGPAQPGADSWASNRYVLTHTLDPNGGCEDLIYYVKDGELLPQEIHLADGRWGLVSVVADGAITEGGTGKEACLPENLGIEYPANESYSFQSLEQGGGDDGVRAWVEEIDGRKYFVLNYDFQFAQSQPVVMDPDTRKLEPESRQQEWKYYDLEWGSRSGWAGVYYLANGKIIGEAPVEGLVPSYEGTPLTMTYYKELPAELAQVYEETVAKLEAYLAQANP